MEKVSTMGVLKRFFGGSRPITTPEVKALTGEERRELAELAAKELGVELEVK